MLARLAAPLAAVGTAVERRGWTVAGDLTGFDLVLPLLAWGYQSYLKHHPVAPAAFARAVEAAIR